jgi:hypothetical protein
MQRLSQSQPVTEKRQFEFVMNRFKKLASGEINWSTSIREYVKEKEKDLTLEHILPRLEVDLTL